MSRNIPSPGQPGQPSSLPAAEAKDNNTLASSIPSSSSKEPQTLSGGSNDITEESKPNTATEWTVITPYNYRRPCDGPRVNAPALSKKWRLKNGRRQYYIHADFRPPGQPESNLTCKPDTEAERVDILNDLLGQVLPSTVKHPEIQPENHDTNHPLESEMPMGESEAWTNTGHFRTPFRTPESLKSTRDEPPSYWASNMHLSSTEKCTPSRQETDNDPEA